MEDPDEFIQTFDFLDQQMVLSAYRTAKPDFIHLFFHGQNADAVIRMTQAEVLKLCEIIPEFLERGLG